MLALVRIVLYSSLPTISTTVAIEGLPSPVPTEPEYHTVVMPVKHANTVEPVTSATAILIYHPQTDSILYAKNHTQRLPVASLTKIMTALTSLSLYQPNDMIQVTNANEAIGQKSDLKPGQLWYMQDLLYALMLSSGNDAAVTLAQHHPGGYAAFVKEMNHQVKQLHLNDTNFTNVSGIDQENHYSTALDMAKLTLHAINSKPLFAKAVQTVRYTMISPDRSYERSLFNLNRLLDTVPGVLGVKTGTTPKAGECLVTYVVQQDQPLIIVVLNSQDRYQDTTALIDWVYTSHSWLETTILKEIAI
jgi:serine-type D-Ala-D-Ala carboxypeptidase (penicillin-binding protein 5/6)